MVFVREDGRRAKGAVGEDWQKLGQGRKKVREDGRSTSGATHKYDATLLHDVDVDCYMLFVFLLQNKLMIRSKAPFATKHKHYNKQNNKN